MASMIMENDSLMSVRQLPWHGLGNIIEFEPNSYEALVAAGLDWEVVQKDVFVGDKLAKGFKANVRNTDDLLLGIVSGRYKIVQNKDAFSFLDELVDGENTRYETAGSLRNCKTVWMLAKMPSFKILDDEIASYVAFINTHDGSGSVKVIATPTRIVCNNTLNYALETASRSWSATHAGKIENKLEDARNTIMNVEKYTKALKEDAEDLVSKKFSDLQVAKMINALLPEIKPEMSDRQRNNIMTMKENFIKCYNADDLANFKGTGWGFVNAASDFMTHTSVIDKNVYTESRFIKVLNGNNLIDKARELVKAA